MLNLYWRIVCRPHLGKISLVAVAALFAGLAEIASVALVIPVVSLFLGPTSGGPLRLLPFLESIVRALGRAPTTANLLYLSLGAWTGLILLKSGLNIGLTYLTASVSQGAKKVITARMFQRYMHGRYAEIVHGKRGEMVQNIQGPADTVSHVIYLSGQSLASSGQLALTLAFLLWLSPWLTLAVCVIGGSSVYLFRHYLQERVSDLGRDNYTIDQTRTGFLVDVLDGIRIVKVHGLEDRLQRGLEGILKRARDIGVRVHTFAQMPKILFELAGMLIVVMLIGLSVVVPGLNLDFPALAAFVLALRQVTPAVSTLNSNLLNMAQNWRQIEVIEEVLDRFPQEEDRAGDDAIPKEVNTLRMEAVSFAYAENPNRRVIRDLSLSFTRGRVAALVGGTGAGKTTIADLIIRLREPTEGRITADGTDIRRFSLSEWRELIGYVGQDVFLFNATLAENIAALDDRVPVDDIVRVAKLAQIHNFITTLPEGYATMVGDRGVKLSGGQRQRIAVARVILRRPQVLILDEATSALDNLTERALHEAIDFIRHEAIVIQIAHRLSTVEDADEILVLQDGRVVERGRHEALLAQGGLYARLYHATPEQARVMEGQAEDRV